MRTMHLFAGAGGGLLADLILSHDPICAVEWDAYCCRVLRERAAEGWFPNLHVHEGDVRLFDPSDYAGRVDCIAAGFPCQDISVAGKGAGIGEGTRSGLYREVLRIAGIVRPRFLWLENVAAIRPLLGTVVGDLAALGYDCRWLCLRASAVGAPHHRDRWWCLADAGGQRRQQDARSSHADEGSHEGWPAVQADELERDGQGDRARAVADSARERCGETGPDCERSEERIASSGAALADSNAPQCQGGSTPSGSDAEHADFGACGWWQAEPDVGRVAYGVASRVDRLRAIGNGQVPLQAAVAWTLLGGP